MPRRNPALILSLVLVGACGSAPASSGSPSALPATPVATAALSAAPVPAAPSSPSFAPSPATSSPPAPSSSPPPAAAPPASNSAPGWSETGTIPTGADAIRDLVGFAGGYLAITGNTTVWYSADGRTWNSAALPFAASNDPVTGQRFDAEVSALTTDGTRVLVVGGYTHGPCTGVQPGTTGGGPSCPFAPLSWISTDGRRWRGANPGPPPADPAGHPQGSELTAAWPVPTGGWDAARSYWEGEHLAGRDLVHSADGITWAALEPAPRLTGAKVDPVPWVHAGVADAAGRRLLWQGWLDFSAALPSGSGISVMTLAKSPDGRTWTGVTGFAGRNAEVRRGVAPVAGSSTRWVLAGASGFTGDFTATPTAWISTDLAHWTAIALPGQAGSRVWAVWSLIHAGIGYVAVGFWSDGVSHDHETWVSEDGAAWTILAQAGAPGGQLGPSVLADGPAGVIGIGEGPNAETRVWRLR